MKSTLTHSVQSRLTNWYLLAAAIALLNLIGIPRVMKTFFSLALEPHRYIVLVFLAKCFFLTSIFLLASCSFSFHWLLVSGDLHVIDRLCLSNVLPSNLKIVLCIAGAINMDNCLIVIGRCFFMIPDDGLSHMKHYVAKKMTWSFSDMREFCKHLAGKCLNPKICVTLSVPDWFRIGLSLIRT